jgi:hypothetical protein
LQKKLSNFSIDKFSPFRLKINFFFLKKSTDGFKSTNKTKKKFKKIS